MFALEINFSDGVSPPEILLVRRPHAIIGSSDYAHVVIEGAASTPCELKLTRGLGSDFFCQAIRKPGYDGPLPQLQGTYSGEGTIALGGVDLTVTSLDIDLSLLPQESPDRAGIRVLRSAMNRPSPIFPAVAVLGATPVLVSFPEEQVLLIGRSRKCGLRLDSSGISSEHARLGFERGSFWVEDLGSTNGTFIGAERISGRRMLASNETVVLGNEFVVAGVANELALENLNRKAPASSAGQRERYEGTHPVLVVNTELVKPSRLVLAPNRKVLIGRDPANDLWVGAPHVSRMHAEIVYDGKDTVTVTDTSSNGLFIGEQRLEKNKPVLVQDFAQIDLGEGLAFAICFNDADEQQFEESDFGPTKFGKDGLAHGEYRGEASRKRPSILDGISPIKQGDGRQGEGQGSSDPRPSASILSQGRDGQQSVFQRLAERQGNRASGHSGALNEGGNHWSLGGDSADYDIETVQYDRSNLGNSDLGKLEEVVAGSSNVGGIGIVRKIGLFIGITFWIGVIITFAWMYFFDNSF